MGVANISTVSTDVVVVIILTSPSRYIKILWLCVPVNIEEHSSTVPISDDTSGDSESIYFKINYSHLLQDLRQKKQKIKRLIIWENYNL